MHNTGHVRGVEGAGYSLAQNMAAFDRLPKAVRLALHESSNNWSAASVLYGMRKHRVKSAQVVAKIKEKDAQIAALNPPKL